MRLSLSMFTKLWHRWQTQADQRTRLDHALKQMITFINPLLMQSTGYPGRYRESMQQAIHYAEKLSRQIPGPIELTPNNFSSDPLVRALFASPQELKETLRLSIAMREYQFTHHKQQCLYAAMGVRWSRKLRYGMEQQEGGMILSDVPQNTINFRDHTFVLPASTEDEARELLRDHFLQRLANRILERTESLKQQRDQLYRKAKRKENELRSSTQPDHPEKLAEIDQLWASWRTLNTELDTDHFIDHFQTIMSNPPKHLYLEPFQLSIDPMGIERTPSHGGTEFDLVNLHGADHRIWTVMLVQFQWQPPPSSDDQIQQASRWLAIS